MEKKGRILLAEDEENLMEAIALNLDLEGYEVIKTPNGKEAVHQFRQRKYDLVILDVMMPELDGFSACKIIRQENEEIPVLFLTAKGEASERIEGLRIGADDYLTKPFNLEELLLRIDKLILRSKGRSEHSPVPPTYRIGAVTVDFQKFEITTAEGTVQQIGKKETALLKLLVERKGLVVSRDEILEKVWGYDEFPTARTVDNYILSFRKWFETNPREPRYFHSVRGVGYRFTE